MPVTAIEYVNGSPSGNVAATVSVTSPHALSRMCDATLPPVHSSSTTIEQEREMKSTCTCERRGVREAASRAAVRSERSDGTPAAAAEVPHARRACFGAPSAAAHLSNRDALAAGRRLHDRHRYVHRVFASKGEVGLLAELRPRVVGAARVRAVDGAEEGHRAVYGVRVEVRARVVGEVLRLDGHNAALAVAHGQLEVKRLQGGGEGVRGWAWKARWWSTA